jgi:hypothetical protein
MSQALMSFVVVKFTNYDKNILAHPLALFNDIYGTFLILQE